MPSGLQKLERDFFRALNSVLEPAVRRGLLSPRLAPAGLIVLETEGYISGARRRTPLLATRLGRYTLVSTARGERSFWVKNLRKQPLTRYFRGGQPKLARAFVIAPGQRHQQAGKSSTGAAKLADLLTPLTNKGWAFAILENEAT